MHDVFWLRKELRSLFPWAKLSEGVDLNGDGKLQRNERTDIDGDHDVSADEWHRFLLKNREALHRSGGFFKYYFKLGKFLRPDNPLHNVIAVEHTMFNKIERIGIIDKAYYKVWGVLERVRGVIKLEADAGYYPLDPKEKLKLLHESIVREDIKIKPQDSHLFLENINDPEGPSLDCDTFSMVAVAVAHEMGWPVKMVIVPGHAFIRWDDGLSRINMDNDGISHSDEWYEKRYGLEGKESDFYMKPLDAKGILSHALSNRAMAKMDKGDFEEALKDINAALESDPDNYMALYREGVRRFKQKEFAGAARIFELYMLMSGELDEERLDRVAIQSLTQWGISLYNTGDYEGAMKAFMTTFKSDERRGEEYQRAKNNPELHYYIGMTKLALGDPDGALKNFRISWSIDKCRPYALVGMGDAYLKKKEFAKARGYYARALKRHPGNIEYLKKMGILFVRMADFARATPYLSEVIAGSPDDVECLILRGLGYVEQGKIELAIADLSRALELDPENEAVEEQLSMLTTSRKPTP